MPIELNDYLFDSGAALVLHGERELTDADLAQLGGLTENQRATITSVVLSNTNISGACFRYLALLPNLKALYVNKTRVNDNAPLEDLPKTLEIINLDHTEAGDLCVSKLSMAQSLRSIRLRQTYVTDRGVNTLTTMSRLHECHVDGIAVSEHAKQRLKNAMLLDTLTLGRSLYFLLHSIQFKAKKIIFRAWNIQSAKSFISPVPIGFHLLRPRSPC